MKKMGVACSMYGRGEKCIQDFGGKTRVKETTWKNQGVDGRIILNWIFKMWDRRSWMGLIWL